MCLAATLAHQRQPAATRPRKINLTIVAAPANRAVHRGPNATPAAARQPGSKPLKNVKEIVNSILS